MHPVIDRARGWHAAAARHESLLWRFHSLYALALGVLFMWLGARNFAWLRLAALHIVVIWSASLALANVIDRPGHESIWWNRLRLAINYVTKNFYQQILFFILPIYYGSATFGSRNVLFVALLAASAVVSTLDEVFDQHLSRRRALSALFFAFNLFAAVAVTLPILWSISTVVSLRIASLAAVVGYVTIARQPTELTRPRTWKATAAGAALLLVMLQFLLPFVPPAPLRLAATEFSLAFDRTRFRAVSPVPAIHSAWRGRIFVVTSLHAPLGLEDTVEIRWYRGSRRLRSSGPVEVVGGRRQGFRLWSSLLVTDANGRGDLRVDVVTGAGQLIGRAVLPVTSAQSSPTRSS